MFSILAKKIGAWQNDSKGIWKWVSSIRISGSKSLPSWATPSNVWAGEGVDFELFREMLADGLSKLAKGKGGRPTYDYALMFKIFILQRYYNLSDDQAEFQICDCLSFMRFLGPTVADVVPDSRTIWNFREQIARQGMAEGLFELFLGKLERLGLVVNEGKIVDASFVEVRRQRNNREENKKVKEGEVPQEWKENPHKLAQKDVDARWTKIERPVLLRLQEPPEDLRQEQDNHQVRCHRCLGALFPGTGGAVGQGKGPRGGPLRGQCYTADKADELHYVSVDGAMFLTREEGWKENKLGRIYAPDNIVQLSPRRTGLTASDYVTHPGDHAEFTKRMDYRLENLNSLVFIADGARWIWKWAERNRPESVQIVDYYHCKEHLCEFAKLYFRDKTQRHKWTDRLSGTMLEKGIGPVIAEIGKLPERQRTKGKRKKLIAYYLGNRDRMQYHGYPEKGLLIGSGAIESAHRDVLQQRLKLSGQHSTMAGFQQMAQLRVVYKSGKEHRMRELCQKAA